MASSKAATDVEPGSFAERVLNGEVVVLKTVLQQAGVFDLLVAATYQGITAAIGEQRTESIRKVGFERIHEIVTPEELPGITDAVYGAVYAASQACLTRLIPTILPGASQYYFESSPNVRFHIPFKIAAAHQGRFAKFTKSFGDGKITAHSPHRDSWVDCPDNVINVWAAIGSVRHGNGLTVYDREYHKHFDFENGYVTWGVKLTEPMTFALEPGDAVIFHSDHLHGSELNVTDSTRYVISFRVTASKPHYPHGHYHYYLHGGLAARGFRWLSAWPQNLQWSFFRYQLARVYSKLTGRGRMSGRDAAVYKNMDRQTAVEKIGSRFSLAELPIGSVKAVSENVCVARLADREIVAMDRKCPHLGGDLAGGWIKDGKLVCPWHNLVFSLDNGTSACGALRPLRRHACSVEGEIVTVGSGVELELRAATRQADG